MRAKWITIFFIFKFFLLAVQATHTQPTYPDSINKLLEGTLSDTSRINLLLDLANKAAWSDVKLAEQYTKEALHLSNQIDYEKGQAYAKFRLSRILSDFDFELSEQLVLESLDHAKTINDSILIASIYCSLGNLKGNFDFFDEAKGYYEQSLDIFLRHQQDSSAAVIYNNLGVLHDMMYPDSLSNEYYFKALEINKKTGNYLWIALNYVNIGINYTEMGQYEKAFKYLMLSLRLAEEHNFTRLYAWIYNSLGLFHQLKGDYAKCILYTDTALIYARKQSNLLQVSASLERLSDAYTKLSDVGNANKYLKQYVAIKDTINERNHLKEIEMMELKFKYDEERKLQQLEKALLENEHYRKEVTYIIFLLVAVLIIISILSLYFLLRNKMRRKTLEQKNTLLEKASLTKDLEYRNKELTTNVMYLMKKNEFISSISDKLKDVINDPVKHYDSTIEKIINEVDRSVTDLNWEDFEVRFQEVHVGFYNKLSSEFPSLTPNDLRLCAFLRLNMTSKEIADITFQSADSLKTARYRLRKKLGIDRKDNLVAFLTKM
jgi:tetratricopeptide (TPR) repeat protein/DNA-binding CsgD family transcriptional regulator